MRLPFKYLSFLSVIIQLSCGGGSGKKAPSEAVRNDDPFAITDRKSYEKNMIIPDSELEFGSFSLLAGELITPEELEADLEEFEKEIFSKSSVNSGSGSLGLNLAGEQGIERYGEYHPMQAAEILDDELKVTKYEPEELAEKEIFFTSNGVAYDAKGQSMKPTRQGEEQIYVMDRKGRMYVTKSQLGKHHHTSFFSGGPIAAGGTIDFEPGGGLKRIDNSTGHYRVPPQAMNNVMSELSRRKVSVEKLQVGMVKRDRITGDQVEREKVFKVMANDYPEDAEYFKNKPKNPAIDAELAEAQKQKRLKRLTMRKDNEEFEREFDKIGANEEDPDVRKKLKDSFQAAHNMNMDAAYSDYKKRADNERKQLVTSNAHYDSYHKKNKAKIRRKISSKTTKTIEVNKGPKPKPKPKPKAKKKWF